MMKKLVVVLMAAFFSFSVAGLSFADEMKKHEAAPAATGVPANPCLGKEMKEKKAKKAAKKKAAKKEEAPAAPAPAPAPVEKK